MVFTVNLITVTYDFIYLSDLSKVLIPTTRITISVKHRSYSMLQSCFSPSHKIGNVGIIANFIFPYICSFLLYFQQMMSVYSKLEIKGYKRITYEDHIFYWNS